MTYDSLMDHMDFPSNVKCIIVDLDKRIKKLEKKKEKK